MVSAKYLTPVDVYGYRHYRDVSIKNWPERIEDEEIGNPQLIDPLQKTGPLSGSFGKLPEGSQDPIFSVRGLFFQCFKIERQLIRRHIYHMYIVQALPVVALLKEGRDST